MSIELYGICNWGRTRGYAKSLSSSFAGRLRPLAAPSRRRRGGPAPRRIGAGRAVAVAGGGLPPACRWLCAGCPWGSSSPPTTGLTGSPEESKDCWTPACAPAGRIRVGLVVGRRSGLACLVGGGQSRCRSGASASECPERWGSAGAVLTAAVAIVADVDVAVGAGTAAAGRRLGGRGGVVVGAFAGMPLSWAGLRRFREREQSSPG